LTAFYSMDPTQNSTQTEEVKNEQTKPTESKTEENKPVTSNETKETKTAETKETTSTTEAEEKPAPKKSALLASFQKNMSRGLNEVYEEEKQNLEKKELEKKSEDKIEIKYDGARLSVDTLTRIFAKINDKAKEEFKAISLKNRKDRRAAKSDEKYIESCAEFVQTLQETILTAQQTVMVEIGLTPEIMEKTMMSYMMEGNMKVIEQVQSTSANLQGTLPHTKEVDKETFKKILEAHLDYILENASKLQKSLDRVFPPVAMQVFQFKVLDHVYEKYGIEEEDLKFAEEKGFLDDPELKELQEQIMEKTMEVLSPEGEGGFY